MSDELGNTTPSLTRRDAADSAEEQLPEPGPDRYQLPEGVTDPELGRGGMGRVVRLLDVRLGREVAVKEILPAHRDDGVIQAMFLREARVLARLEHPGVVPVYELGRRPDGTLFYAMRRVRGEPLSRVLSRCATLEERLHLLDHYLAAANAVAYAHSRGVVHRDLKPDNVMLSRFGETHVIDWGLAVVEDEPQPSALASAGTPATMAPEQAAGQPVSPRTDVWALGVMLYELLTGQLPFPGAGASEVIAAIQQKPHRPARSVEPAAPAALVKVVDRALEKEPSLRFANAEELADAVEAAIRTMRRPPPWTRVAMVALGAAAVLAIVSAVMERRAADAVRTAARDALDEAAKVRTAAVAGAATRALQGRDTLAASELARDAKGDPLADGVAALAAARGTPARRWSVRTEAGCGALALSGELVACASLGGVALYHLTDGKAEGTLQTGPRGWQHAVAALSDGRLAAGGDDRAVRIFSVLDRRLLEQLPGLPDAVRALAWDGQRLAVGLQGGDVVGQDHAVIHHHPRPVSGVVAGPGLIASSSGRLVLVSRAESEGQLDRRAGALAIRGQDLVLGVDRNVVAVDLTGNGVSWGQLRHDVTALTVTGGGRVVAGSADGELMWFGADGVMDGAMSPVKERIRALAAREETVVLVAGQKLEAWTLPAPVRPVWDEPPTAAALAQGDRVLAGFSDGRVRAVTGTGPSAPLEVRHAGPVRALAEVPGAPEPHRPRLVSGGEDGAVYLQRWNGEVEVLDGLPARITAVAVSPDGARAAWAAEDGTVVLTSLQMGKEIARSRAATTRALAFSPDGQRLAAGREDRRVAVYAADTGQPEGESDPTDGVVTAVAWTGPGAVAAGRADGRISEWDARDRRFARSWTGPAMVTALHVEEGLLVSGAVDGRVRVYQLESPAVALELPADAGDVRAVGVSGAALVFAGTDRLVHRIPLDL